MRSCGWIVAKILLHLAQTPSHLHATNTTTTNEKFHTSGLAQCLRDFSVGESVHRTRKRRPCRVVSRFRGTSKRMLGGILSGRKGSAPRERRDFPGGRLYRTPRGYPNDRLARRLGRSGRSVTKDPQKVSVGDLRRRTGCVVAADPRRAP